MEPKSVTTIGSKEFVDFPDFGLAGIPARVDTGAKKSAIWASNITRLEDNKLSFNLFAPGYTHYVSEPIVTSDYRSTFVKNSFGDQEFRYVVRLRLKLGDRTLRRWFTLADRSRNTYPVLLGRNFLRKAFVVNVAASYVQSSRDENHKVLIFTRDLQETTDFFNKVQSSNKADISYTSAAYDSLVFMINGRQTAIVHQPNNVDIASYDFTYFKNHHDHEPAYAAAEYLRYKGRQFADQEFVASASHSKLSEYVKLSCHGLPVPASWCAKTPLMINSYEEITTLLGSPFVLKATTSDKGKNNYLIDNPTDFVNVLQNDQENLVWLAQKYIPNDGFYRVYVLDRDAVLAVWRGAVPHENPLKRHLNKPRGSANAELVPMAKLPVEAQTLAIAAAGCMNRQIAGVDLLRDKNTNTWYILEANNDPQIRSGSFVEEKVKMMADFFDRELGR